jgi:KaiC/GvpD/RAD55 family RecA-like ATPase
MLIISTRTTAREVQQKLEYYEVDEDRAVILDTLSIERGYTRRQSDNVKYVSSPDDLAGIVAKTREFLASQEGKLRVTVDSLTEMLYYADEEPTREAVEELLDLLATHDAVGLFHLAAEVHDTDVVDDYRDRFDDVIELHEDGTIDQEF